MRHGSFVIVALAVMALDLFSTAQAGPLVQREVTAGGQIPGCGGQIPIFSPLGDLLSPPALVPSLSLADPTAQATFGFVIEPGSPPTGNLEYDDHPMDVRIKAQSIDALSITSPGTSCPAMDGSKHATFTGMAQVIRSIGVS